MRIDSVSDPANGPAGAPARGTPSDSTNAVAATVGAWAKDEWTTLAGAAHGLAATPGVVSQAWRSAGDLNARLAAGITMTVDGWDQTPPAARRCALEALNALAAPTSEAAHAVAGELARADAAQLPHLPADVAAQARSTVADLQTAAATQSAKAAGVIPGISRFIGGTAADAHAGLTGVKAAESQLSRLPVLGRLPLIGAALTAVGMSRDVLAGVDPTSAAVANIGGTLAGTAAGSAVTAGLATVAESGSIADTAGLALGAAAAAGPAGWTVAAGAVAAAAVGYGIYRAVESEGGQRIVGGLRHALAAPLETGVVGDG